MVANNSLALIYLELENYQKAIFHLQKELEFRKKINNKADIATVLINLSLAENEMKSYDVAIDDIEQAISISKELSDLMLLKRAYGVAYDIYQKEGIEDKARGYFELYSAIDKKLKEQKMSEITTEAKQQVQQANTEKAKTEQKLNQTSSELEKTSTTLHKVEQLTREQQMELELRQSKINEQHALLETEKLKRRYLTVGVITLTLFVIVLTFMIFKIRLANKKIEQQRQWLEKQNKEIKASIRYAQTIQEAMLPAQTEIERYFDPFILYWAKDIVSGDFYWISTHKEKDTELVYFAVVDCTGHGVPGAFMSMIANRLLSEIVIEKKIYSPANILTELNQMVRKALRQEETDNNDGMDVALFCLRKNSGSKYKLIFSGAKRPLYIMKNTENKLVTCHGNRKSIGGYSLSKNDITFNNYETEVSPEDMVYLFSDGIVDQNSPDRKKFGRSRLEEALEDCRKLSPSKQKAIIEERLSSFMEQEEQRDDITLIGLKIL